MVQAGDINLFDDNSDKEIARNINIAKVSKGDIESYYTVSRGDTLSDIALRVMKKAGLKISSTEIMKTAYKIANFNRVVNPNLIFIGQKIDLSIIEKIQNTNAMQNEMAVFKSDTKKIQKSSNNVKLNKNNSKSLLVVESSNNKRFDNIHLESESSTDIEEVVGTKEIRILKETTAILRADKNNDRFMTLNQIKREDGVVENISKNLQIKENTLSNTDNLLINKNKRVNTYSKNKEVEINNIVQSSEEQSINDKSGNMIENIETIPNLRNSSREKLKIVQKKKLVTPNNKDKNNNINEPDIFINKHSSLSNTAKVVETKKELEILVEDLINKADKPGQLPKFKKFKQIISLPFGSTPLFLQTLESQKIAQEKKNVAFSKFLPQVTSSVGGGIKSGGSNNDSSSQSKNFTISQLVYDFGVTSRQYKVTEKEELSSKYKIDQQRTDLLFDIITAFYEVYRAETLLKLSQEFVETRKEFLESVKVRQSLGGSSNADVIRAETKLSEALDKIPTEVKNLKNSKAIFLEYFDMNTSIKTELHQVPSIEDVTFELNNENIDKNFKIAEISNQIKAAQLNYEAQRRSRFGKFGLQAGYQNTDTNLNTPQEQSSILLTYQIDVFSGFESRAKISQANLKVNALRFEMERMRKEIIRELSQSENSYEAQSALVLSRVALVKGAELSNQVNRELFELNKTSINDLFRSQEEFLSAAKNLVDATVEKNLSFYRLAANFGTLLNLFELRT